ncbi:homoprotocatechuate degradation operon regulator HpaR [Sulfitobacter pacificus]|uniref:Homoprotocatechuate degradation operon regulator, HpaR n=1 Tax=Sulfitobacter pacificus TaxID=1499314 RepID=A0ABQ5VDB9_9RHOB|nr:homoprotocatechuate degradation operon regulator HpaR [Sulfitobacter pacificus]GLQ25504.1 homoprotocatechuate degradation operon regulator, HpaR [Sulfitobacter pacificus]
MTKDSKQGQLPDTERSLPIALIRAREKVMAPIREMLSETGITEQQWRVLRVLSEHDSLDATEVADRASLHQPSLTRILKTLGEKGFITRSQDAQDRRRQVVMLTKQGHGVIESNMDHATRIAEALRAALGSKSFDQLLNLLAQLDDFSFEAPAKAKDQSPPSV